MKVFSAITSVLALAAIFSATAGAQQLQLGNPTTGTANAIPFAGAYTRMMSVYTSAELAPIPNGSLIREIQIHGNNVTIPPTFLDFQIRLAESSTTTPTSTWTSNFTGAQTLVLSRQQFVPATAAGVGTNVVWRFPLDTPYAINTATGLNVDFQWSGRIGTGFNVIGDTLRTRVYTTALPLPTVGTLSTAAGNFGIELLYQAPPTEYQFIDNNSRFTPVFNNAALTDAVVLDANTNAVGASRDLSSVIVTKSGTVPDASINNVKLVVDVDNSGSVTGPDIVLGTLPGLTAGTATFSFAPPLTVPTGTPPRILFAISTASPLTLGATLGFQITGTTSVTWGGGADLTTYPVMSLPITVTIPQVSVGIPGLPVSGNTIPFNSTQTRFLTAYTSAELANIPAGSVITEIRVHGSAVTPVPSWSDFQLSIGHTTINPAVMSSTFANNFAGTPQVVLQSASYTPTTLAGPASGTLYRFALATPFVYNGTQGLTVDWQFSSRSGTGFNVYSQDGRRRVYTSTTPPPVTGTLGTVGNFGMDFLFIEPSSALLANNSPAMPSLNSPMTDTVVMAVNAFSFGAPRALNSIRFRQTGSITDPEISNVKLVQDINGDGFVDGGDVVLGSGTLAAGAITFTGSPTLVNIAAATSVNLLLAVTMPVKASIGTTMKFEILAPSDVTWSPGPDASIYPISGNEGAARLEGTYTIANGNPGFAYDFGDLGDAFDALETIGMSGPVVLELHDTGGPFTSKASYQLGADATVADDIVGLSATNTVTIRNASGHSPVITGSAASNPFTSTALGTLSFSLMGNWHVDGIEITGGANFGIMSYTSLVMSDVSVRNCKIHGITLGPAIFFYGNSGATNNAIIENNMCWNCGGDAGTAFSSGAKGVIGARRPGTGWIIRHNTIVHAPTSTGSSIFFQNGNTVAFADISYNIIHFTGAPTTFYYRLDAVANVNLPTTANRNVIHLSGGALMCNNPTFDTFSTWQIGGRDLNSINGDPLLVSAAAPHNLHVQAGSPAIDLAVGSTATVDIDGNSRPTGLAPDAGADEAAPIIELLRNTTTIAQGGTDNVGTFSVAGGNVTFTIRNGGAQPLSLTGTPLVALTPGPNLDAATAVQQQPTLTTLVPTGTTTFVVLIDPTASGPFSLGLSIASDDLNRNPFTFTVTGLVAPDIDLQRPVGITIPNAGSHSLNPTVYPVGTQSQAIFTISNANGGEPLNITGTNATGVANVNAVSASAPGTSTVAVGNSTTFTVSFTPVAGGPFSFTASVTSNDPADPTYTITVNGDANTPPTILVTRVGAGGPVVNAGTINVQFNTPVSAQNLAIQVGDVNSQQTSLAVSFGPTTPPGIVLSEWSSAAATVGYTVNPTTGVFSIPGASYLVTLTADDGINTTIFTFTIAVSSNVDATINLPAGSAFAGSAGAGYTVSTGPVALGANYTLQLFDGDANSVSVTAVSVVPAAPAGITAPGITSNNPSGTVISFSGNANLADPGTYTWTFTVHDGFGAPVNVDVSITVLNVAASHAAGMNAAGGDGSVATPYAATSGLGSTPTLTLADVADANDSQTLTQVSVAGNPANPSNVFTAAFAGTGNTGLVTMTAGAKLTVADVGEHTYTVQVSDGVATVSIVVRVVVDISGNTQPMAGRPVGSTFLGTQTAGFTLTLGPGEVLTANALLELSDPDSDPVELVSVTGGGITGVTAPAPAVIATTLAWAGTIDSDNAPGVYVYTLVIRDNVTMPVTFTVSVTVLNVAPSHAPVAGIDGDGSVATPYSVFHEVGRASPKEIATLSDVNTSQTVTLSGFTPAAGNPSGGSGFVIAQTGNSIFAVPGAVLKNRDVGVHRFTVTVTDGISNSSFEVTVKVVAPPQDKTDPDGCVATGRTSGTWFVLLIAAISVPLWMRRRLKA